MISFHRFALLFLASLGIAVGARADDGYVVKCRYYHQDAAVMVNTSMSFVKPIGFLGGYVPGTTATFTCDPTALSTLEHAAGYYVAGWDLDLDWGDAFPGTFSPTHVKQYGAVNPLAITFSESELGIRPKMCELVPRISMMHYTLAYDANAKDAEGTAPDPADHYWSESVETAERIYTRAGYQLTGWNTKADGTGVAVGFGKEISGATFPVTKHEQKITLYAQWKANEYKLHLIIGTGIAKIFYKARSSEEAASSPLVWKETTASLDVEVAFGSEWQAYATPKPGYSYSGPTEKSPRKEKMTADGATFEPTATAGKVTVAFSGNGATSGSVSKQTFTVDEAATLNENQYRRVYRVTLNPNSAGASVSPSSADAEYAFACWNNQADGKGAYTYANQERITNPCGATGKEVMLYAQWSSTSASVTLPTPILAGSSFGGWYAESACKTKLGDAGDRLVPTKDITLYAKWGRDSFTVSFRDGHRDAGDALIVMQTVAYGEAATPPAAPTHDGWRFVGWDTSDYLKVTHDLTVRALYESGNYHVTYNSNYQDGQTERSVESAGCGPEATSDRITLLSAEALAIPFNKTGYRFLGWAWNANATEPDWLAGAEMAYSVIADYRGSDGRTNLYAVWQPISYTIVFASNGGTGTMSDQVLTYDRPALLTKNAFTLEGKTFYGWRDGQGHSYADEAEVVNLTATANATITLTAQWEASTTSERFVCFNSNGGTGTMSNQSFKGTTSQHLYANAYSKTGYTFAGWATSLVDAAARRVTYTDRAEYAFKKSDPVGMTKTLYAVWEPIHYTIIFNTGTNNVTGTIQPIINCEYDKNVNLPITGYTHNVSPGIEGWTGNPGGENKPVTNVSNLATIDGEVVTLYAVWKGCGKLSEAVGLTNACLTSECVVGDKKVSWNVVTDYTEEKGVCIALTSPDLKQYSGTWNLRTSTTGSGTLKFRSYWEQWGSAGTTFKLYVDGEVRLELPSDPRWTGEMSVDIETEGVHTIVWELNGSINNPGGISGEQYDKICLDDIRWTPDSTPTPDYPTYNLTYANTKGASLPTSLPKSYKVTSETFEFARLKDVSGWKFAGWSPSKIVKGTTGDITVTAKWEPVVVTHTVTFDLAGGTRTGGGALTQTVEHGYDAVAPEFAPPAGRKFTGWDKSFANVTADLKVKALYDTVSYRIDYVNTLGLANPNPLRYTKEESIVFAPLGNTAKEVFTGWSPSKIAKGTTGNVTVTANWVTQQTWTVTFQLGEHVARTGGGALVQKVVDGGKAETPTIVADAGYVFEGWDKDITCVRADLTTRSKVTAKSCKLSFDGVAESVPYGSMVTRSTFAEKTVGPTNLVCVGWTGSGCVPASGTSNEVEFQATGDGSLAWNYVTNWLVSVDATEGGSLTVVDSKGAVVEEDEFWAKNESRFTLEATPDEGWRFLGWRAADGSLTKAETTTRALFVAAPVSLCAVFGRNTCQVSFVLGEHLTRTGGGALEQTVDQGEAAVAPTVKAATGYVFDNWDSDFSRVITNMTVRAIVSAAEHDVTFVLCEHLSRTGGGALKQTVVHGEAAEAPKVKAESGYRFVGWDRSFTSVKEDLTVTAQVEEKPLWTNVVELARNEEMDPIELDLDALFGERAEEVVSVSVGPLPSGLTYDATEQVISGTPKKSGITLTTVTGKVSARESLSAMMTFIVRAAGESVVQVDVPTVEGEIPGKTTGQGVYAAGKKVTLKATANKGYVFSGWYEDSLVSRLASLVLEVSDDDVVYEARFITAAQDAASVQASVNGMPLLEDGEPVPAATNVWAGLPLVWPLKVSAESAVKVSVSGLPSGLKFTAKDIVDSKTKTVKVPAMTVYGTPTAGGKTSTVKVTVTTAGKTKTVAILQMTVDALPVELVGTYAGGSTNDPIGSATVTLAKTGKVSGKWISEGMTWTIAAASLSGRDEKTETFTAEASLKNGKSVETVRLVFGVGASGFGTVTCAEFFDATFVNWKFEPLKSLAVELKGQTFTFEEEDVELSGKVGASGVVTVKGAFDVGGAMPYPVSAKGTLVPVGDDLYELFLYYPPKTNKGFDGYARTLVLHWNGICFDIMN